MFKKKAIVLICLLLPALAGFAQTWFPNGTTWHYNYRSWNLDGTKTDTYVKYEAVRDTIVNSKTCKVIYQTRTLPQISRFRTGYLMYEENEKVYRLNPMTNVFDLYYDINAAVGTSWQIFRQDLPFPSENLTIQVLSKGTSIINGQTLKKLNISINYPSGGQTYQDEIIERIGFRSMFTTVMPYMIDPLCRGLRCFDDNVIGSYSFNITPTCTYQALPTGSPEEIASNNFKVFPNPFQDNINIEATDYENIGNFSLHISNILGQEIENYLMQKSFSLNTASFKPGIYFISITQVDKVLLRKKIIKQ